ncbi:unnamed protein product [Darwinula stevensoni]|uniref:Uncharacterized protein n=1 Tax=Darwinula stevensoni TaxID=69355 RepID=A0A7R9AEP6_9CRUS|nr:unnamed protein product [Darwinula stevensoni]CAG0902530.1 unnamed protein product [Darwinula stevensoni]
MRSRMSLGARESGERRMRAYRSLGDSRGSLRFRARPPARLFEAPRGGLEVVEVLLVAVGIWLAQVYQVALNEETLGKARTLARPYLCSTSRFRPPGYGFVSCRPDGFVIILIEGIRLVYQCHRALHALTLRKVAALARPGDLPVKLPAFGLGFDHPRHPQRHPVNRWDGPRCACSDGSAMPNIVADIS